MKHASLLRLVLLVLIGACSTTGGDGSAALGSANPNPQDGTGSMPRDGGASTPTSGDGDAAGNGNPPVEDPDCAAAGQDQLRCVCVTLAQRNETPPAQLVDQCKSILAQDCCEDNQICLTGGGGGDPSAGGGTATSRCVARPAGCDSLSCACFASDPCAAAGFGLCAATLGALPSVSRTLSCQSQ